MKKDKKWKVEYDKEHTKIYIKTCIELCWQMAIQSPPVHILFEPTTRKAQKFDKNKYQPYISSGDAVEYFVWPPLYLHEGGPMLCKGVAQGKRE